MSIHPQAISLFGNIFRMISGGDRNVKSFSRSSSRSLLITGPTWTWESWDRAILQPPSAQWGRTKHRGWQCRRSAWRDHGQGWAKYLRGCRPHRQDRFQLDMPETRPPSLESLLPWIRWTWPQSCRADSKAHWELLPPWRRWNRRKTAVALAAGAGRRTAQLWRGQPDTEQKRPGAHSRPRSFGAHGLMTQVPRAWRGSTAQPGYSTLPVPDQHWKPSGHSTFGMHRRCNSRP